MEAFLLTLAVNSIALLIHYVCKKSNSKSQSLGVFTYKLDVMPASISSELKRKKHA